MRSVKIEYHEIQKENFLVPKVFSCIEKGTFALNNENDTSKLFNISNNIERAYLNGFENTQAHFIAQVDHNVFSEITLGKTLAKTKQVCMGYFEDAFCMELLNIANKKTMKLDFWFLIA